MSAPMTFDASPLSDPIDPAALREFRRTHRAGGQGSVRQAIGIAVGAIGVLIAAAIVIPSLVQLAQSSSPVASMGTILFVVFIVGGGLIVWRVWVGRVRRAYRLSRFAAANALQFVDTVDAPPLPGMIFDRGSGRRATSVLRGSSPRMVEFADYEYSTGSGKDRKTHHWHYIALRMENRLPNIVLDAQSNNFLGSNLPTRFHRDQQLSLEGDFDRHFRLYCPAGYETDALYLFTPDVMANFIDTAGAFDVEIIDDWVFLYAQGSPNLLLPSTWEWQFRAVRTLLEKIAQWERWRDDRLAAPPATADPTLPPPAAADPSAAPVGFTAAPANPIAPAPGAMLPPIHRSTPKGVAPQGRRLRRSVNWGVYALVAAVALFMLFRNFIPTLFEVFNR